MISYAQNFEDVMLARALGDRARGFYVDIGACFPDVASVTRHFYELGWSGVNVEPMDEPFARLAADRPRDVNVRAAVAAYDGEIAIYEGASVGESSAVKPSPTARPLVVPCFTLAELCRRHVTRPIDFLKIDVEGLEHDVIAGGDWQRYRPSVVVVEVTRPWSTERRDDAAAIGSLLAGHDYDEVYFDGLNAFFLAREASALAPRFAVPPNVLDRFTSARESELAARVAQLQGAVDATAARMRTLEEQASTQAAGLAALTARAAQAESRVETLGRDGEALRSALHEREGRLEHAQRAWQDAVAAVERLQAALATAASERSSVEQRLRDLAERLRVAEARASDAEARAIDFEALSRDAGARALRAETAAQQAEAEASAQKTQALADVRHAEAIAARADAFGRDLEARFRDSEAREQRALARALQAEHTIASMLRSRSWRITAPLRALADLFRGGPRGLDGPPTRRTSLRSARASALRHARSLARRTPLYDWAAPHVKRRYPLLWKRARALVDDHPPAAAAVTPIGAHAQPAVASATGAPVPTAGAPDLRPAAVAIDPDASVEELTLCIQREIARRRVS